MLPRRAKSDAGFAGEGVQVCLGRSTGLAEWTVCGEGECENMLYRGRAVVWGAWSTGQEGLGC